MTKRAAPERRFDRLPDILTVEEAAIALGVSIGLRRAAIVRNEIPSKRMGRRILVSRKVLEDFVQGTGQPR